MDIVLVGHRGCGKTTLSQRIARASGYLQVDLDHEIESRAGATCAEIIADSEARFRQLEHDVLTEVLASDCDDHRIISVGGGCQAFPVGPIYIWVRRTGWWEVAASDRDQVWPEITLTEEFARMRTEREPRWAEHAHIVHDIPRGRTVERSARNLATRIEWLTGVADGWAASRTWAVVPSPSLLERALSDAASLGLAGVELRSDLFDMLPAVETPHIASLRGPDPGWLDGTTAAMIDIDIAFAGRLLETDILDRLDPRPLLLSTHPHGVDASDVESLARAAQTVAARHPQWADQIALKYAPHAGSPFEAGAGMAMMRPLQRRGYAVTYIPQGRDFAWLRPVLLRQMNAVNYLAVGLSQDHVADGLPSVGAAWDLGDWLGHLSGPAPELYDVLIGANVAKSQGDLWHRRAALADGEATDYLKVDVQAGFLEEILTLFQGIGIRGVSVTSPHKERILTVDGVEAPTGLDAVNTLRRTDFGWTACDTDTSGMVGALREIEDAGIRPGKIAVIGGGGVADAVLRGIEAAPGWRLELHVRAREGWPEELPDVRLIVNAAGNFGPTAEGVPPRAEAWLDLHYADVALPPGDYRHFIGDAFFEFQAREQRDFWADR